MQNLNFDLISVVYRIFISSFQKLNSAIIYDRDYSYNYFGFKVCSFEFFHF